MTNRHIFVATLLTVLAVTGYQLRQLETPGGSGPLRPPAAPVVESAPSLQLDKPQRSSIASLQVWNLVPAALPAKLPSLKDMFKPYYSMGRVGRFESIQRSDRPSEQWQFQGVLVQGSGTRALFYNPGLRKLKNLGRGELVDERLVVRAVGPGSVTLEVVGEKKPLKFDLRILNANKESYVAKRKTP